MYHSAILKTLQAVEARGMVSEDLKEEVLVTLDILKRLDRPQPPTVQGTTV